MDTTIANANTLHRLLFQSLLPPRAGQGGSAHPPGPCPAPPDAGDTLPMLYRSEAFAEDLFDSHPLAA